MVNYKKILLFCGSLFLVFSLLGQDKKDWIPENYLLQIKYNPTALLTPNYPGLQAGVEYRLNKNWTILHEFGVFRRFASTISFNDEEVTGFRARSGLRWYLAGHYQNRTDFFLTFQLQYKRQNHRDLRFVERFGGAFREEFEVVEIKNFFGGYVLAGWQGKMTPNSRWEVDMGMGIRRRWINTPVLPDDAILVNDFVDDFSLLGTDFFPDIFPAFTVDFRFNFLLN